MMVWSTENSLDVSGIYSCPVIEVYGEFEEVISSRLSAPVNHDMSSLGRKKNVKLPENLSGFPCEYLVLGEHYFDFNGKDSLIRSILNDGTILLNLIQKNMYKDQFTILCNMRNHAAHSSEKSRKAALSASGRTSSWPKAITRGSQITRFSYPVKSLKILVSNVEVQARY